MGLAMFDNPWIVFLAFMFGPVIVVSAIGAILMLFGWLGVAAVLIALLVLITG